MTDSRSLIYTELGKDIYIAKESENRMNILNSILIEDNEENDSILIDANYPFELIDELYTRIKSPAKALIFSHSHTDHMAHGFYHLEKYGTPLFSPVQEEDYILSIDALMENAGFKQLGLEKPFTKMVREFMKFKEAREINTYNPGKDKFSYASVEIETIHIPGHSPGHTAFLIRSIRNEENRKILYISDLGSHPYYGDLNCDLKKYRKSIDKIEKIYKMDDFILVPAHGTVYFEKDELYFQRIRDRIQKNTDKVIKRLSKTNAKSIKELVLEGTLSENIKNMQKMWRDMHFLWDGGAIYQHLLEFIEQDIVEKTEEIDFLNDKYILL